MKNKTLNYIFAMPLIIVGLFIFAFLLSYATMIESFYNTDTAFSLVYGNISLEILMGYLAYGLVFNIIKYKMYKLKKLPLLIFHSAFIVILIGAFTTRYLGYEGIVHIREGESQSSIKTSKIYLFTTIIKKYRDLDINCSDKEYTKNRITYEQKLLKNKLQNQTFSYKIDGNTLTITLENIHELDSSITLYDFVIKYKNSTQELKLSKKSDIDGIRVKFAIDDLYLCFFVAPKSYPLGFDIKLDDFELTRYIGSNAPSSFKSYIALTDNNTTIKKEIFMNNTLDYKGFRFFQSSYDLDENGTILSANYDPGKIPTYIGYFLLMFGLLLNLFNPYSRFRKLLGSSTILPMLLLFAVSGTELKASSLDEHTKIFSEILVQSNQGRIKPINTLSYEIANKLKLKNTNVNANLIEMIVKPLIHQNKKLLKISPNLAYELNTTQLLSYNQLVVNGIYKLDNRISKINITPPLQRNKLDKELLKLNEKINIMAMVYTGDLIQITPMPDNKWITPNKVQTPPEFAKLISMYLLSLDIGLEKNEWKYADKLANQVIKVQKNLASELPTENKIKAEIMFYNLDIFSTLLKVYLIFGLLLMIFMFIRIYFNKTLKVVFRLAHISFSLFFIIHIVGLVFRWYISGHAPWSNAYESMLYIAFSIVLAGLLLHKKSFMILASSSILAGVFLFVAHLSWVDPQITNLVPVLKSYWLMIHVSVITASYGFFGLSFLIGLFTLLFMTLGKTDFIKDANKINELSMIVGLTFITIGNFLGGIWANESWGRYWGWDAKETWALISILIYTCVLHFRLVPKLRSNYIFALSSVVAFSSIVMTYLGVNHFLKGLHSYAAGDALPIPDSVYVSIFVIITLAIVAKLRYHNE